jgi:hypothetical protein
LESRAGIHDPRRSDLDRCHIIPSAQDGRPAPATGPFFLRGVFSHIRDRTAPGF